MLKFYDKCQNVIINIFFGVAGWGTKTLRGTASFFPIIVMSLSVEETTVVRE